MNGVKVKKGTVLSIPNGNGSVTFSSSMSGPIDIQQGADVATFTARSNGETELRAVGPDFQIGLRVTVTD